jgi:hypothetical protein
MKASDIRVRPMTPSPRATHSIGVRRPADLEADEEDSVFASATPGLGSSEADCVKAAVEGGSSSE